MAVAAFRYVPRAGFFDRLAVLKAMDAKARKALSRFGAFVRTRARSSMRRRKAVSQPGAPPSAHAGDLKKIYFAWDAKARSVVIGPLAFGPNRAETLEYGGTVQVVQKDGKIAVLHYRPRPFMQPAFDAELARAPELLKE